MTAYRFCRTDDMELLVSAYERCRGPEDADAPRLDRERFKELVRELDLWCSSCMVAFEGREAVGVLLGAKRAESTLVYGLRVHPEHRRRGHGRHLLTSLGQKLAILGPPRLVAEVPQGRAAACAVFSACGWRTETRFVDWRRDAASEGPIESAAAEGSPAAPSPAPELLALMDSIAAITLDDLAPRGGPKPAARPWHRELPALRKQAEKLRGLGFHSAERLEAWLFYRPSAVAAEILAAGFVPGDLGRMGFGALIEELARRAAGQPLHLARAAPDELPATLLESLGFRPAGEHVLFSTSAEAA